MDKSPLHSIPRSAYTLFWPNIHYQKIVMSESVSE
ncbi:hypothetical protein SLEP1_g27317 [Rubroshorea leprosula]|uniref:Uncharacterized protein n=1 Tax=Rubroshorea leprosula TaxID=152421 RepID=A0AAV5JX48_9ROSI|nr:hypothetical protein SLEP1_g27317 [Rubroshorea leprosula]